MKLNDNFVLMIHQNLAITDLNMCKKLKFRVGRKHPPKETSVVDILCRFNSKTTRIHAIYCVSYIRLRMFSLSYILKIKTKHLNETFDDFSPQVFDDK